MLELFHRRPSLLASAITFALLGACTAKHETEIQGPEKKAAEDTAEESPSDAAAPSKPGEQVAPEAAAAAGLSTDEYKEGRLFVNGWNGLVDELASPSKWQVTDLAASAVPTSGGAGTPASATPPAATATATATTTTPATDSGATPPAATGSDQAAATPPAADANPDEVVFHIRKGTGQDAWNTASDEVVAKVGKKFTIVNDDDIVHRWHTNGTPCRHGNDIAPGKSATCVPSRAYSDGPLYDHYSDGKFYIRAE